MSLEPSGAQWCARFPGSDRLEDLEPTFQANVRRFIGRLEAAGAKVTRSATYRPPERAYLMHWCCLIATGQIAAADVPAMAGVSIDWTHGGNSEAAHTAAILMKHGYNIAFPAALVSRHTQRRAIDMSAHWAGTIHVIDARGVSHACNKQEDLWPVGAADKVMKLASDAPHWSDDGH